MARPKLRTWIAAGALLLLGGLALAHLWPALLIQKQLRELRAAGLPTSAAELDISYAHPAKDNAAFPVLAAVQRLVQAPQGEDPYSGKFKLPPPGEPLPASLRGIIQKQLRRNQEALGRLKEIPPGAPARYPMDLRQGPSTLLPHLAQIKAGVLLLKLEAIDAACSLDAERAIQAILSGFAVADTLSGEPLLISQLVRIASISILLDALERVLSAVSLSDAQLATLIDPIRGAEEECPASLSRAYAGERAISLVVFEMSPAELERSGATGDGPSFGSPVVAIAWRLREITGLGAWDKSLYLEVMARYDQALALPFPEKLERTAAVEAYADGIRRQGFRNFATLSRILLPSLASTARKEGFHTARLRCAGSAIAVERYRAAHGGLKPASLGKLIPDYLSAVPADPFDDAPLRLEADPGGGFQVRAGAASAERAKSPAFDQPGAIAFSVTR